MNRFQQRIIELTSETSQIEKDIQLYRNAGKKQMVKYLEDKIKIKSFIIEYCGKYCDEVMVIKSKR